MTKKQFDGTPKFDGSDYKKWKLLVQMWEKVTDIEEGKRGAALILKMSGNPGGVRRCHPPSFPGHEIIAHSICS